MWVNGSSPGASDVANFSNGGDATVAGNVSANSLTLGADTTLSGNGSYTLTTGSNNPLAGGHTLTVDGAKVVFSTEFALGTSGNNLTVNSGSVTMSGYGGMEVSATNWQFDINGGTVDIAGNYNYITGSGDAIAQTAGTVTVTGKPLELGNSTATYTLSGGTLTTIGLTFTSGAAFNFVGTSGTLFLKNSGSQPWNFASLTGIANSLFEVNGVAATSGHLAFVTGSGVPSGYTQISAVVPEPASIGLLGLGGLGLLLLGKRRKTA